MKRKLLVSIISLAMILSSALPIFANTSAISDVSAESENAFVIRVDSDEEMQEVIQMLEENNRRVNAKWEEVVKNADQVSPVIKGGQAPPTLTLNQIVPLATTKSYSEIAEFSRSWYEFPLGWDYFNGYVNLRGTVTTASSPTFVSVSNVYLKSDNTKNKVEDFTYQLALLDGGRTYGVQSDCFVLVYRSATSSQRYPLSIYHEFYAAGGYSEY